MKDFPKKYTDPRYDEADAAVESRLGLPSGLLSTIRIHGEKTDADRVSSAGARTPYQITPTTRQLILKKYGIDPYLNPDTASEAAGLLLKESLDRNNGDIEAAVGEYHGGTSRENWGRANEAYRARVIPAFESAKSSRMMADFSEWSQKEVASTLEQDFGQWLQQQPAEAPPQVPSMLDPITGESRETPETQSLPDWSQMPEYQSTDLTDAGSWAASLGRLSASPEEAVQILQANMPGVSSRRDSKGNIIIRSGVDGQEYAVKPGFTASDIPRAVFGAAAFTPAGRATGISASGLAAAGTQALIEGSQATTGGEFNAGQVAGAGVIGAAIPAIAQGARAIQSMRAPNPADDAISAAMSGAAPAARQADNIAPPAASPAPAVAAAVPDNAPPVAEIAPAEFGALARQAAGGGMGAQKAKEQLAAAAAINPEAKAAADAIGVDLPVDLISDSRLLQETVGLSRGLAGTEASAAWAQTVKQASDKADDVLRQMDASTDIASVSESVKQSLAATRNDLDSAAGAIYKQVDDVVPKSTAVDLTKTRETIQSVVNEVGEQNLSAAEKRLFEMSTNPSTTYGALLREKSQIGAAMKSAVGSNPYGSVETGTLKRLYGALADDQLEAVGASAGKEMRDSLRLANQLTAKRKALETRIVNAFGKEGEGSIANKLKSAINTGSKGDIAGLNKVLKIVPKDQRREVLATGLMSSARTPKGSFSFGQYEKLYKGLRDNKPVYAEFAKEFDPNQLEMLRSLYVVSKRINQAENMVMKTGKANQALVQELQLEGLVERVMDSVAGKAVSAVATRVPGGSTIVDSVVQATTKSQSEKVLAAGKMLTSPEFEQMVVSAAKNGGQPAPGAIRRLAASEKFAKFAKAAKLPTTLTDREQYILSALQASRDKQAEPKGKF